MLAEFNKNKKNLTIFKKYFKIIYLTKPAMKLVPYKDMIRYRRVKILVAEWAVGKCELAVSQ